MNEPAAGTVDGPGVITGNTYDKYGSGNPVVRRLMAGFERTFDELGDARGPELGARRGLRGGRADRSAWRGVWETGAWSAWT